MGSDEGKLFVGGISRETDGDILKDHFSKYGNVEGAVVAKDRFTKTPRGFGFVSFSEATSADKALQDTHVILGRTVEVKKAIPRSEQQQQQQPHHNSYQQWNSGFSRNGNDAADSNNHVRTKKIFVGGLSPSLTEEEFKNYFEGFGRITDVVVMHDSSTNRPRGFGFVTFESEESVENVMQNTFHKLNNRIVEVKRAVPKEGNNGSYSSHNMKAGYVFSHNGFQSVEYLSNSLGYGVFPGYAPLPEYNTTVGGYLYGTGVYGSGYPILGYGKMGYGVAPVTQSAPLYAHVMYGARDAHVMYGARAFPVPYGSSSIYPPYANAGVNMMGTMVGGFNGITGVGVDGKWNQVLAGFGDLSTNAMPPQIEGINFGNDHPGLRERSGGVSNEQDQKGLDGHLNALYLDASR